MGPERQRSLRLAKDVQEKQRRRKFCSMTQRGTLLGIEGYVAQNDADVLVAAIRQAWSFDNGRCSRESGRGPARKTVVRPGSARSAVSAASWPPSHRFPEHGRSWPAITFRIDPRRWLVTPEGRCVLTFSESLPGGRDGHAITDAELIPYERLVAAVYVEWSRHRLKSVADLLGGYENRHRFPLLAVIALLVNRCTSDRALIRFASGTAREVVDRAFFSPCKPADVMAPSKRRSRGNPQLVSGWMF